MSHVSRSVPSAESWITAGLLSLSGGFQDAYSYFIRGKVFANAQTGNIVLFAQNLCVGDFAHALTYLVPLFAFTCGVFVAELYQSYFKKHLLFWQQRILFLEALLLFLVGFLPPSFNWIANALISFSCAMQVQSFRIVSGRAYASTMCVGNLRSAAEHLFAAFCKKSIADLNYSLGLFLVILLFAIGAGLGYLLSLKFYLLSIWVSSLLLILAAWTCRERKTPRKVEDDFSK